MLPHPDQRRGAREAIRLGHEGPSPKIDRGLDDVVVKTSRLTFIDGERGRLLYAGYDIRDLVEHSSFEETAFLLWHLRLPNAEELVSLRREIAVHRKLPTSTVRMLRKLPKATSPIDALRTAVSAIASSDPELEDSSRAANLRKAIRLTAKVATIVAAYQRIRNGLRPLPPNPALGQAEDYLRMLLGRAPPPRDARILDRALVMYADHSLNASAFAAVVTGSTLADLYAAVVAAIAALKGRLHGGAIEGALNMLLKIGSPERAEPYVLDALKRHEKIMGFGHRVYKTYDPRALLLRDMARALAEERGERTLFETASAVQEVVVRELAAKRIFPNVDYYAGLVYHILGMPTDSFTPTFAVARVAGWTAQVLEYWDDNELMRPLDWYVGPREAVYVPLDRR